MTVFSVINADTARLDLKQKVLILTGVQGEINGVRLHTAGLKLDLERKQIASSHPLSFKKEGLELQANQMEGNFETEEYLLWRSGSGAREAAVAGSNFHLLC